MPACLPPQSESICSENDKELSCHLNKTIITTDLVPFLLQLLHDMSNFELMTRPTPQTSYAYIQAPTCPDSNEFDRLFQGSDLAKKGTPSSDHSLRSFRPENQVFVNNIADSVLDSGDVDGVPAAQNNSFSLDDVEFNGSYDVTEFDESDTWLETFCAGNFGPLPESQADPLSLDLWKDFDADWLAPWEDLPDRQGSNAVPTPLGNNYQPTPDLTECSIPASHSPSNGFRDPTNETINNFGTENQRWHATLSRCRAADRYFLYGVLTTKIFCRPSCASRRPSRRHVRFFAFPGAIEAAEQAKFRPCKRCKPDTVGTVNTGVLAISQIIRRVIAKTFEVLGEAAVGDWRLESLAKSAGLSTFHLHRLFKATVSLLTGVFNPQYLPSIEP